MQKPIIICLMGPTASGKTSLAIELIKRFPCEIISVDSAMVYRGMDIGTAKPSPAILKEAPHRLIDILDPAQRYSAGQFRTDALQAIAEIHAQAKIPLLVGGTMMYFRILQQGLAVLPSANKAIRDKLQQQATQQGWESLHAELMKVDSHAALRINPADSQRIQRALEVYYLTGVPMTEWQKQATEPLQDYQMINLAVAPSTRERLHQNIEQRLSDMFANGFVAEVKQLYERSDLSLDLPSIRSVGYAEVWRYLAGEVSESLMQSQALAATRQLAKRQLTWLRSWLALTWFASDDAEMTEKVSDFLTLQCRRG